MRIAAILAFVVLACGHRSGITQASSTATPTQGDEITPPVPVHRVNPKYEECAKEHVIAAGLPVVEVMIGDDGIVREAKMVKPIHDCIDRIIVEAVKQWRFRPATHRGKAVRTILNLTVHINWQ